MDRITYIPFLLISLFLLMNSCAEDDNYKTPNDICFDENLVANATFEDVKDLYQGELLEVQDDFIIEGYVVSSDEENNFFGRLVIQNSEENPSSGFELNLDFRDLYLFYPIGQKILIKTKGLFLDNENGVFKLGGVFSAFGTSQVGRLPAAKINEHIFVSCEPLKSIQPKEFTLSQLDSTAINTLVTITGVEVTPEDLCKPFAEPEETTIRTLTNCGENKLLMESSGYANFQSVLMPLGNGSITGVLTRNKKEYILTIRELEDVAMNNARCNDVEFYCETPTANATISEIKELHESDAVKISENLIFSGTITANDASGNFYKEIYVQDESGGIKILVDETNLSEKGFGIGENFTISTKGMQIDKVKGEFVLGLIHEENELEGIEEEDFYRFFYAENTLGTVTPELVSITELSEEHIGKLVQLNDVQFASEGTFVENNRDTEAILTDCLANEIVMNTSRRFSKGENVLPTTNGSIIGILQYDEGYTFRIRSEEDVIGMINQPCNVLESAKQVAIIDLPLYAESSKTILDNIKIKGTVISDAASGNLSEEKMILQDETGGIEIRFDASHEIPLNTSVEIALRNVILTYDEKGILVTEIPTDHILKSQSGSFINPIKVNLNGLSSYNYNNTLVLVDGFQFEDENGVYSENNVIANCNETFTIPLLPSANFLGDSVENGNGKIVLIPLRDRLYVRNKSDFQFDEPYEDCSLQNTSEFVFISEIADPDNSSTASNMRFIELYNSGSKEVNLSGWQLRRYTNANMDYTERSVIDLSAHTIPPQSTFVIAADSLAFESVYGFKPTMEGGTGGAADSNGDDNIELVDGNGKVVDVFGVPGEDGSGTNHEFEDGRALRASNITTNNPTYTFEEWIIYNDTGGSGTTRQPQMAPQDFSAGVR
ncbi:DUF5689 domain-containing protein [Galbibacter mesophilus]|uniref:DUF5689 domain-containing protein n=1 Tax=Galbibacter mesophilus TaxID=379069 RepID=UPI00191E1A4F|nr:DUF5689 domain-containing protein [Galbibacter mesophilus]MCM5662047.1 DUF5689 domain-containing protein [Galbibacter mesophilus]